VRITKVSLAGAGILLAAAFFLNCGGPLQPLEPGWRWVAPIPGRQFGDFEAGPGGVYGTTMQDPNTIVRYANDEFKEVFRAGPGEFIWDLAFYGNVGWAAGEVQVQEGEHGWRPFLYRYNGRSWSKVELGEQPFSCIHSINPIDAHSFWAVGGGPGRVVKYTDGAFEVYPAAGEVVSVCYDRDVGMLYCGEGSGGIGKTLTMTADGGATWQTETLQINYTGYRITRADGGRMAAAGGVLFIPAEVDVNGEDYSAVLKRTGPPGAGEYELSFLSNTGAHFNSIYSLVFQDVEHGLAVGPYTSMLYTYGVWRQERIGAVDFSGLVADPAGGWWGICLDHSGQYHGDWLVHHP